jgi:hypothetical protein
MIDLNDIHNRIRLVDQVDRAMLRSNQSAWSMPEDEQEHILKNMLLSSSSSFGFKAINLLSWCLAPTKVKNIIITSPVRHMSGLYIRLPCPRIWAVSIIGVQRQTSLWPSVGGSEYGQQIYKTFAKMYLFYKHIFSNYL